MNYLYKSISKSKFEQKTFFKKSSKFVRLSFQLKIPIQQYKLKKKHSEYIFFV